jgi:hypothetical protein
VVVSAKKPDGGQVVCEVLASVQMQDVDAAVGCIGAVLNRHPSKEVCRAAGSSGTRADPRGVT